MRGIFDEGAPSSLADDKPLSSEFIESFANGADADTKLPGKLGITRNDHASLPLTVCDPTFQALVNLLIKRTAKASLQHHSNPLRKGPPPGATMAIHHKNTTMGKCYLPHLSIY